MNIFGMVSTKKSQSYTVEAVATFFRHTPPAQIARFILIDNDRSLDQSNFKHFPRCEIIAPDSPRSFAENLNSVLSVAEESKANLFFLNNDLIFTADWLTPLLVDTPAILSPLSNRERPYIHGTFRCDRVMSFENYIGNDLHLERIAAFHRTRQSSYQGTVFLPFFCVKIPYSVYSVLGKLDESFGKGGAEDNDYCLRAYLSGFSVQYAPQTYVLHFSGKSTWDGAETSAESKLREEQYLNRFREKWGDRLTRLSISFDRSVISEVPSAQEASLRGDVKGIIQSLLP